MLKGRVLKAVLAACLLSGVATADAAAATGDLVQKPGAAGCLSTIGFCFPGTALDGASSLAVSPDGQSVYVVSAVAFVSDSVAVFDRDADGALVQKPGAAGCIQESGAGPCRDGTALDAPVSVAVSPDGQSAYIASAISSAVAVFDRAPNGRLVQKPGAAGCISLNGIGPCAEGTALVGARSVTVSPDGQNVYVAAPLSDAVAVFDRAADGTLAQKPGAAGCISLTGAGRCADGKALNGAVSVALSADGKSAYVASAVGAVAVFDRAADGTLAQKPGGAGCIRETGAGSCADGTALDGASSVAVSPDGRSAYVASVTSAAVAVFDREPSPPSLAAPGPLLSALLVARPHAVPAGCCTQAWVRGFAGGRSQGSSTTC